MHVQPGAKRNQVTGFQEGVLRVKISVPPIEGRANEALISFLAKALGVRKSHISIVMGQTSRDKVLEIVGMDVDEILQKLSVQ